jgi:large subunit ribosomal protein L25
MRELEVECLPNAIPEEFAVDVSEIEVGQSLHVRDIPIPEGVDVLNDPDVSIMSVVAPVAEEEAPAEEVEEGEGEGEGEVAAEGTAEGAAPEEAAEKKSED